MDNALMENVRLVAATILLELVDERRSLSFLLPAHSHRVKPEQRALLQQLVYGSARFYFALDELIQLLVRKPIKPKERLVHMLLAVGMYQLWKLEVAEHAAINETVDAVKLSGKQWAVPLVNASLRRFQREQSALLSELRRTAAMPGWLNKRLKAAWPEQYSDICRHSNEPGPMTLRVNHRQVSREAWVEQAKQQNIDCLPTVISQSGVTLTQAVDVQLLPGFDDGWVSVQDEAAQLCASLLKPLNGERVLDACAAPGGKSGHLLEWADIELTALDVDADRMDKVESNLQRLRLAAALKVADASDLSAWWDGEPFDAILLDAPCSGTGVIRRHPDIKLLRKSADISTLAALQQRIIDGLWQTLKPGGRMLYATCSILPDENSEQIRSALQRHADARCLPLALAADVETEFGVQFLPQTNGHDGFFYALLEKAS